MEIQADVRFFFDSLNANSGFELLIFDDNSLIALVDIQKGVQICIAQSVGNGDHEGCGTGVPDVCTSVSTHYDWIMEQIK